ncbi:MULTISPECIES: phage holin family protein [unclassified Microbacterium]|uniref:phage holin family protein n=1 Tax=unclassified Microbacterium TaxID=2609290 RepID=UPI00036094D3|nr:phage holin family protein [Microbacterium sp. 77mftsu3.1]SDG66527.1 Putative Holin-X, holin superfamily III [Microbacterium sp. 77mftsu3.1]
MSTPRGFRDRRDESLLGLVGELPELVKNLIVAEITAAKTWAARTGKDAGIVGLWFVLALFFLFWTLPAIGAFTVIGLSSWMAPWLAALILVVLGLLLVVITAFLGYLRVRRMKNRENPAKALSTDARIVKEVADEF